MAVTLSVSGEQLRSEITMCPDAAAEPGTLGQLMQQLSGCEHCADSHLLVHGNEVTKVVVAI